MPSAAELAPGHSEVLRITAPNPGPMTLEGTNTYVVGESPAWVVDPGPADAEHLAAVRACVSRRGGLGGILLTHSHADHGEGVEPLGGPLAWGRPETSDEAAAIAAAWEELTEAGETISLRSLRSTAGGGGRTCRELPAQVGPFELIATPGHARDHVAFAFGEVCFCGDLILGEGSSIVPPAAGGGSLGDYMDSLARLGERGFELLCPGHGPWIENPAARIDHYASHRLERERALLAALHSGERSRERLLDVAWSDVAPAMRAPAALAMRAHLEKLAAEGRLPED